MGNNIKQNSKITIVGAGNVGAAAADIALNNQLGEIVLIDIVEGLAEGKALDMAQARWIQGTDCRITGTADWAKAANSDIVIVTSGMPRKPGMSRDDLLAKNTQIVKDVSKNIKKHCPDAFVIVVCNPLDAMVYAASKVTGFETSRIMGMAGALDCARFANFVAEELDISISSIRTILMGGHGDTMVPLVRYSTAGGIPVSKLLDEDKISAIVERTRKGGIEIVNLMGTSAYYAPAAGAVKMADAILRDKKLLISCCAYCESEYSIGGYFVGTPAIIGSGGVEKVVEIELDKNEKEMLNKSVEHVKTLCKKVDDLL